MRIALLAVVVALSAPAAIAQDPFLTGDALKEAADEGCAEGCVLMTRKNLNALMRDVEVLVEKRSQEAYKAGKYACWKAV